ncbi:ebp domain containing protein [Grosmannia clavigera kw1407]|uniref:Ebp domain containing protein n=1 Tax=Grosmannia clavigera (strain kw1407 / UAMH 11150) TaxID=655863 RepID=F0XC50_GROCL|nr:ebp domain containing protein [Grosmannia clavigera kw1407]EFX04793.1 ebp domain containing protein [Grosmannia clavigera kw1407]
MDYPYYPPGVAIPAYRPNVTPLLVILASFGIILGAVLSFALVLARRLRPQFCNASASDQSRFLWFVLCYFVLNHATLAGSQSLVAQLWKEYALSDSRYLTSDPFTLCVEAVTVVAWGPLCWATAVSIVQGSGSRYPLQMLICLAHLYGVALYYGTVGAEVLLHGVSYFRPEPFYVWVYFIGMNAPWVLVPAAVLYDSFQKIQDAVAGAAKTAALMQPSSRQSTTRAEPKKLR